MCAQPKYMIAILQSRIIWLPDQSEWLMLTDHLICFYQKRFDFSSIFGIRAFFLHTLRKKSVAKGEKEIFFYSRNTHFADCFQ